MTLGEALATEIAARKITQKAAATEMGTLEQNVNRWIRNGSVPAAERHEGLRRFLGVTELQLLQLVHNQRTRAATVEHQVRDLERRVTALEAAAGLTQSENVTRLRAARDRVAESETPAGPRSRPRGARPRPTGNG